MLQSRVTFIFTQKGYSDLKASRLVFDGLTNAISRKVDLVDLTDMASAARQNVNLLPFEHMVDVLASGRLTKIGNNVFKSKAGLVYSVGGKEGHRLAHILKHADASSVPSDGVFGVFNPGTNIVDVIDRAWAKRVKPNRIQDNGRRLYWIELDDVIGYRFVDGVRENIPTRTIRIVVEPNTDNIVTAFPDFMPLPPQAAQ